MTAKERLLRLAQRKARIDALQDRLIWLRQKAAMAGTRYSTRQAAARAGRAARNNSLPT